MKRFVLFFLMLFVAITSVDAKPTGGLRRVLVISEANTPHQGFCDAAHRWFDAHSAELGIKVTYIADLGRTKKGYLDQFDAIVQLNYPPYAAPHAWSKAAAADFERYIDEGHGGYVGFHHASLLGDIFGAGNMWQWFSDFMGGIRWKGYVSTLADATCCVEDARHPVMLGVPDTFRITKDEWYTYNHSPRPNVRVLAHVDEASYTPASDVKMGDHPVIWTNEHKLARNVYFQIGHSAELFDNPSFVKMFSNAVRWSLGDNLNASSKISAPTGYAADYAPAPRFRALLLWDPTAEEAHVQFAKDAQRFFHKLTFGDGYRLDVTTDFHAYVDSLQLYSVIIMANAQPKGDADRAAFQHYMENGGGWVGFHAAGYNDKHTNCWPWLNEFLGCGVFYCNNWPPQPALVENDRPDHQVMSTLPVSYVAPASEFYQWNPSPRQNTNVEVLQSISPKMYPFGIKDVVKWGDFPIVWTNTKYRMIYLNMGHGDEGFIDATQNLLFTNAFRWVVSRDPKGNPFVNK